MYGITSPQKSKITFYELLIYSIYYSQNLPQDLFLSFMWLSLQNLNFIELEKIASLIIIKLHLRILQTFKITSLKRKQKLSGKTLTVMLKMWTIRLIYASNNS